MSVMHINSVSAKHGQQEYQRNQECLLDIEQFCEKPYAGISRDKHRNIANVRLPTGTQNSEVSEAGNKGPGFNPWIIMHDKTHGYGIGREFSPV